MSARNFQSNKALLALIVCLIALVGLAQAAPDLMSYQGRLLDDLGNPVTSQVTIRFEFYDAASGGTALPAGAAFVDEDTVTPNASGYYDVVIGDPGSLEIPASIFMKSLVWLSITVDGEELLPRKQITAVGYAMNANNGRRIVADFTVADGQQVEAGDIVSVGSDRNIFAGSSSLSVKVPNIDGNPISAAAMDNSRFILASDDWDNDQLLLYLVDDSGSSPTQLDSQAYANITMNLEYVTGQRCIGVSRLGNSSVLVGYAQGSNIQSDSIGYLEVVSVSGDTLQSGTAINFGANTAVYTVQALSATRALALVHRYDSGLDQGTVTYELIGISGQTLTVLDSQPTGYSAVPSFMYYGPCFSNILSWNAQQAVAALNGILYPADVTGDTITVGSTSDSGYGPTPRAQLITGSSDNAFFLAYTNIPSGGEIQIRPGSITGNAVSLSTEQVLIAADDTNPYLLESVIDFDSSKALIGLGDDNLAANEYITYYQVLNKSASALSLGEKVVIDRITRNTGSVNQPPVLVDWGGGNFSIAFLKDVFGLGEDLYLYSPSSSRLTGKMLGVAAESGSAGQSIPVIVKGISDLHSGLTPGSNYYFDNSSGEITTNISTDFLGLALSATELLLD